MRWRSEKANQGAAANCRWNDSVAALCLILVCVGCATAPAPYIQDGLVIVPPVKMLSDDDVILLNPASAASEREAWWLKCQDGEGKIFYYFMNHWSDPPGEYFICNVSKHPEVTNSVKVLDKKKFLRAVGAD
jgi:hypothetical protein